MKEEASNRKPLTSIVSYPERGEGGDNRYRGNCSPKLIEDLIGFFKPKEICDYMCGSGTTKAAADKVGIVKTFRWRLRIPNPIWKMRHCSNEYAASQRTPEKQYFAAFSGVLCFSEQSERSNDIVMPI